MVETWARKERGRTIKVNPTTKVDALAARRVLRDCYRAKSRFIAATSTADRRLWWILAITLLRAVGPVLSKVDSKRSSFLAKSIRDRYQAWKDDPFPNLIFHEFVEKERNEIIKEYRIDRAISVGTEASGTLPELLLIGDQAMPPAVAIASAIRWWEGQLLIVKEEAGAAAKAQRMLA